MKGGSLERKEEQLAPRGLVDEEHKPARRASRYTTYESRGLLDRGTGMNDRIAERDDPLDGATSMSLSPIIKKTSRGRTGTWKE